jgi:hydrogenase nickel incorporation protein HypA/HybF
MHELGLAQEVVAVVAEKSLGARVIRVVLEIGKLSAVLPDALRFCFDVAAAGTAVEGARLEIIETAGLARCLSCGGSIELDRPYGRCACGSTELEWIAGEELRILEMEVV